MNRAKGRAAFGFRAKLQSRAESLRLEVLDIRYGMSTHESREGWRRIRIYIQIA